MHAQLTELNGLKGNLGRRCIVMGLISSQVCVERQGSRLRVWGFSAPGPSRVEGSGMCASFSWFLFRPWVLLTADCLTSQHPSPAGLISIEQPNKAVVCACVLAVLWVISVRQPASTAVLLSCSTRPAYLQEDGTFALEDEAGSVPIDLTGARAAAGLVTGRFSVGWGASIMWHPAHV